jgi:hypothetical protein
VLSATVESFGDFCEGDGVADVGNLDGDSFAFVSVGDDDDEAAFDAGDAIALVADGFDLDGTLVVFFNGWSWPLVSVLYGLRRRFGCTRVTRFRRREDRDTIRCPLLEIVELDFVFRLC